MCIRDRVYIVKEHISPLVATFHPGLHELRPHVRQTDLMVCILIPVGFQMCIRDRHYDHSLEPIP